MKSNRATFFVSVHQTAALLRDAGIPVFKVSEADEDVDGQVDLTPSGDIYVQVLTYGHGVCVDRWTPAEETVYSGPILIDPDEFIAAVRKALAAL